MEHKTLSSLTDQELLQEAKKQKSKAITNALFIGVLIGIVCFSVFKSGFGLFTLIPLFVAYKLINKPKYDTRELDELLKERKLK
jgi:uncharacterized protein YqhQ